MDRHKSTRPCLHACIIINNTNKNIVASFNNLMRSIHNSNSKSNNKEANCYCTGTKDKIQKKKIEILIDTENGI